MGLDNFWHMPDSKDHPEFDPPLNLCGGMFSEHGLRSFRGKVYAEFCKEIMSLNLYQDIISPEEIEEALYYLNSWIAADLCDTSTLSNYGITHEELLDLQRMFSKYSALGARLESWY